MNFKKLIMVRTIFSLTCRRVSDPWSARHALRNKQCRLCLLMAVKIIKMNKFCCLATTLNASLARSKSSTRGTTTTNGRRRTQLPQILRWGLKLTKNAPIIWSSTSFHWQTAKRNSLPFRGIRRSIRSQMNNSGHLRSPSWSWAKYCSYRRRRTDWRSKSIASKIE